MSEHETQETHIALMPRLVLCLSTGRHRPADMLLISHPHPLDVFFAILCSSPVHLKHSEQNSSASVRPRATNGLPSLLAFPRSRLSAEWRDLGTCSYYSKTINY